jgi:hypothetical protein
MSERPFIVLVSEVEQLCRSILEGDQPDIPYALYRAEVSLAEAKKIAAKVSLEALEKIVEE